MADIRIRGLDDHVKALLQQRAASHRRSMEAEVREILTTAVSDPLPRADLFDTLITRFDALGGVILEIPTRA